MTIRAWPRSGERVTGQIAIRHRQLVSLETTNRYAKVDLEMKAKALATCAATESGRTPSEEKASWRHDRDLMTFLNSP